MTDPLNDLVEQAYGELRAVAHRELDRHGRPGAGRDTLGTTALVNEVYLRLADHAGAAPSDRAHFLARASVAMRHILIDRARARLASKRGGGVADVSLDAEALAVARDPEQLLEIDEALHRVAAIDARLARVVELRFFGGMSEEEIATALGVTSRTVARDWQKARALLKSELAS